MNLGELEFKAEDFEFSLTLHPGGQKVVLKSFGYEGYPGMQSFVAVLAEQATETANRLLRERLAKAPEVFSEQKTFTDKERGVRQVFSSWRKRRFHATHRTRLVCIEEIK